MPRARSRSSRPTLPRMHAGELVVADRRELPDRLDAEAVQPLLRLRADAGQQPDRERREERRLASGPHDGQTARLAPVGRDLRDDLRRRDAERAREMRARADDRADGLGDGARVVERRGDARRDRGSPRRSPPARRTGRSRAPSTRPPASSRGRACGAAGRTPRAGSGGAPRRPTSPNGSRTSGPRSWRSRRPRGRAGRRRRSGEPCVA